MRKLFSVRERRGKGMFFTAQHRLRFNQERRELRDILSLYNQNYIQIDLKSAPQNAIDKKHASKELNVPQWINTKL